MLGAASEETLDLEVVKIILGQIDFSIPLMLFIFAPYCLYMLICLLYFYDITQKEGQENFGRGFVTMDLYEDTLRGLMLVYTFYWLFLEVILLLRLRMSYLCLDRLRWLCMVFINLWITIEHSTNILGLQMDALMYVCGPAILLLYM